MVMTVTMTLFVIMSMIVIGVVGLAGPVVMAAVLAVLPGRMGVGRITHGGERQRSLGTRSKRRLGFEQVQRRGIGVQDEGAAILQELIERLQLQQKNGELGLLLEHLE